MIAPGVRLTPGLARLLRAMADDGTPALLVRERGTGLVIHRSDGSDLSESELRHVRGVLAAHAIEPL